MKVNNFLKADNFSSFFISVSSQKISRVGSICSKANRLSLRIFVALFSVLYLTLMVVDGRAQGLGVERVDSLGSYIGGFWRPSTTSGFFYSDGSFVPGSGASSLVGGANPSDPTYGGFIQVGSYYTGFNTTQLATYQQAFPWASFTPSPGAVAGSFSQYRVSIQGGGGVGLGWGISRGGLGNYRLVAAGDLNRDNSDDFVFQSTTGSVVDWLLHGLGAVPDKITVFTGSLYDWRIVAMGDLNRDGIPDLIFQNSTGAIVGWLTNGAGAKSATVTIYGGSLYGWRVVAMGDMNADGIPDLIFQNSTGAIVAWLMNGAGAKSGSVTIYSGSLSDWKVVAMGDLDGDGIPDLVFQNTAGAIVGWQMNGYGIKRASITISNGPLYDWRVVAMADLNLDGIKDLIFQNNIGQLVVWVMNGSGGVTSTGGL